MSYQFADVVLTLQQLATRFDRIGAETDLHVPFAEYEIQNYAIQAGRLLNRARADGAFAGDRWWAGWDKTVTTGLESPNPVARKINRWIAGGRAADDEVHRALHMWTTAICSWLRSEHAHLMPHDAGHLDWNDLRVTDDPTVLAEYKRRVDEYDAAEAEYAAAVDAGERDATPPQFDPVEGLFVRVQDSYREQDAIEHVRMRARVYADACRAVILILEGDSNNDKKDWLTVTTAAELLAKDIPSLSIELAKTRVSRAANDAKKLRTNGKKGKARRIDPVSFDAWRLKQRDKSLDAEDNEA